VIHRDIKPANLLLQDGQPVIADFGIALAVGAAGGARLTETGLSVGTPYYMSPEQATGDQVIGPTSDIYALACVLYEMLVGEPPFPGATAQAVLGKIISGHVASVTETRPQVPPNVDAAIRRALEKLAADRFPTAADFAKALGDRSFRYGDEAAGTAVSRGPWKTVALSATGVAVALGALAGWALLHRGAPEPVSRYAVELPDGHNPGNVAGSNIALSPDGSEMVYVGPSTDGKASTQLWLRRRDQLDPKPMPGTDDGVSPSFSPDGKSVAYLTQTPPVVKTAALDGAPPITVTDTAVLGGNVTWAPDGNLYYPGPKGIERVAATGGKPTLFSPLDSANHESFRAWIQALPNGKGILFTIAHENETDTKQYDLAVADLATGTTRTLVRGVVGRYAPTGDLIYVTADGSLLAAPFDQDAMKLTGAPVALTQGVGIGTYGSVDLSVADDGTLAYVTGEAGSGLGQAVWVTRDGTVTPVDSTWQFDPGLPEANLALSPDGKHLAVSAVANGNTDIWVKALDVPHGPLSRLTFDTASDTRPRWSRDGKTIRYISTRGGYEDVWTQPADGTGSARLLLHLAKPILEDQLTPDGKWFLLRLGGALNVTNDRDIVALRQGDTTTVPVAAEPYDEKAVAVSPDGRLVAYESTETGSNEIYVRPFPNSTAGKWQVSAAGGINPVWAHSGRELFYVDANNRMVAAEVSTEGGFHVTGHHTLFSLSDHNLYAAANYAGFDVSPDGKRFVMLQMGGSAGGSHHLVVVENFFTELRRKMGG
jgi:serine/threonine-protein kinase